MASGGITPVGLIITVVPTVRTRKKVPISSTTYLRMGSGIGGTPCRIARRQLMARAAAPVITDTSGTARNRVEMWFCDSRTATEVRGQDGSEHCQSGRARSLIRAYRDKYV